MQGNCVQLKHNEGSVEWSKGDGWVGLAMFYQSYVWLWPKQKKQQSEPLEPVCDWRSASFNKNQKHIQPYILYQMTASYHCSWQIPCLCTASLVSSLPQVFAEGFA